MNRRQFLKASTALAATAPLVTACGSDHSLSIDRSLPVSPFGAESTAEEVTLGLDLTGKTALVTGCNSGIGYECMRVLALRGAHVIGTGRTMEKATRACASVEGNTTPLAVELSDFQSSIDCAAAVSEMGVNLDMLILNAGISSFGDLELINGIEKIFVVNYLGHFVLAMNLLPRVEAADHGRIVHVGSQQGYKEAPPEGIDFDNLRGEKEFNGGRAYGRSKLANALFSLQLSQRLDPQKTTSNAVHPGFVQTNIARNAPAPVQWLYEKLGPLITKTVAEGAATQTYVATAPALQGVSGAYFEDCNPVLIDGPNHVYDRELAQRLWDETLMLVGEWIPPQAGFVVPTLPVSDT
jgi:NAD(P)-dependent dehydrogenase (short-subunit alcohol dehydrogenase family)